MKRRGDQGRRGRRGGAGGKIQFEAVEEDDENDKMQDDGEDGDQMEMGSSDEEQVDSEEIESEWEFFPLGDGDWHAVKQHCARLLDGRQWDAGGLASVVTETQREVGSAIKIGERTSEALGIGAVVSLRQHGQHPALAAVQQFVVGRFEGPERRRVETLLSEGSVGLLLNERILNLPPLVALQLHLSMFEEMSEHRRRHGGGGEYALDHLLLVTVAYRESAGDSSGPQGNQKKKRDKAGQLEWFRPEEEVYMQHAVCSAAWPVAVQDQASRWTFDGRVAQFKVVMLVPTSALPAIAARFEAINNGEYDQE